MWTESNCIFSSLTLNILEYYENKYYVVYTKYVNVMSSMEFDGTYFWLFWWIFEKWTVLKLSTFLAYYLYFYICNICDAGFGPKYVNVYYIGEYCDYTWMKIGTDIRMIIN